MTTGCALCRTEQYGSARSVPMPRSQCLETNASKPMPRNQCLGANALKPMPQSLCLEANTATPIQSPPIMISALLILTHPQAYLHL
jgi:hypothetical protein